MLYVNYISSINSKKLNPYIKYNFCHLSLFSSLCLTTGSPPNLSRQVLGDTIIFRSVQMGSSAVYQCNASNQHGYLLANAFVSVLGETQTWEVDLKM